MMQEIVLAMMRRRDRKCDHIFDAMKIDVTGRAVVKGHALDRTRANGVSINVTVALRRNLLMVREWRINGGRRERDRAIAAGQ